MIPEELFGKIIKYHLLDQKQEEDDIKKGLEKKEIIKQIAKDRNTNKNEIYQKFLKK